MPVGLIFDKIQSQRLPSRRDLSHADNSIIGHYCHSIGPKELSARPKLAGVGAVKCFIGTKQDYHTIANAGREDIMTLR
eukprot:scaffold24048_cov194-Amphora_coffeaeformis.AAC.13